MLDPDRRVIVASRRARESLEGLDEGSPFPEAAARTDGRTPLEIPYAVDGRQETLVYVSSAGDVAAYEELRAGFTAAVSHELRTPLARLLALLESAALPGSGPAGADRRCARGGRPDPRAHRRRALRQRARERPGSGRAGLDPGAAVLERRLRRARAGGRARGRPPARSTALRTSRSRSASGCCRSSPRTWRATRSATPATARRSPSRAATRTKRRGRPAEDDGVGVAEEDLPRLFERFYRSDRARASRGTGLGLAIVKHIVTAAGGTVDARSAAGAGLRIECRFPGRDRRRPGRGPAALA